MRWRAGIAYVAANAGLDVVLIEEGPLRSSSDFRQRESDAYPALYQESAGRKTADKAITILQGRCVGGSTTVNWTSSFRTPPATLAHWRARFGLKTSRVVFLYVGRVDGEKRLDVLLHALRRLDRDDIQLAIAGRGACLVVLDNFEQVARYATETLGRWLDVASKARFVVTTREVLGLPGETTLALAPVQFTHTAP